MSEHSDVATSIPVDGPRWLDDDEQAVWRSYLKSHRLLMAHLNRNLVSTTKLSEGDYAVLVALSEAEGTRMRAYQLARDMQWEKSRLSHQLTRMETRGLVRRENCPSDARGAFVALTEPGREAVERAAPIHVGDVRRFFFDALTTEQLATLSDISAAVLATIEPACAGAQADDEEACSDQGCER